MSRWLRKAVLALDGADFGDVVLWLYTRLIVPALVWGSFSALVAELFVAELAVPSKDTFNATVGWLTFGAGMLTTWAVWWVIAVGWPRLVRWARTPWRVANELKGDLK